MTTNIYNNYEKEMLKVINTIEPKNFYTLKEIIKLVLFNHNISLPDSIINDYAHKIVRNNIIHYRTK